MPTGQTDSRMTELAMRGDYELLDYHALAQPAPSLGLGGKMHLRGVLDGQDMASGHTARDFPAAMLVQLFNGHGLVPQKAAECDFLGNTARQFTQANVELLRHPLRQQRPFFAAVRRRSCQSPSKKIPSPTSRITPSRISRQTESHISVDQHNVLSRTESVGRTRREVFTDQPPLWGLICEHFSSGATD